jgi:hypothetical protein
MPDLLNIIVKDKRAYGVEQVDMYKRGVEAYKGLLNKQHSRSIRSGQNSVRLLPKHEELKVRVQKQVSGLPEKCYEVQCKANEIHSSRDITNGLVPAKQSEIYLLKNQSNEINTTQLASGATPYNKFSRGHFFIFIIPFSCTFVLLVILLHECSRLCVERYRSNNPFPAREAKHPTVTQPSKTGLLKLSTTPPDRIPLNFLCPGNFHSFVPGKRQWLQENCMGLA